ncbi:MAG: GNAT family N-acetyltransferase [Chloroflexota bacterium]
MAVVADARAIARVRTASWRAAYAGIVPHAILERLDAEALEARFEERIAHPGPASTLVVEDRERHVVGFASVGPARDDDLPGLGEVYAIYLDPAFRGLGFGRNLFAAALARLFGAGFGEIVLWVFTDNHPARRFYERHGFALDGQARMLDFDGQPIEEVRYRRSIST